MEVAGLRRLEAVDVSGITVTHTHTAIQTEADGINANINLRRKEIACSGLRGAIGRAIWVSSGYPQLVIGISARKPLDFSKVFTH